MVKVDVVRVVITWVLDPDVTVAVTGHTVVVVTVTRVTVATLLRASMAFFTSWKGTSMFATAVVANAKSPNATFMMLRDRARVRDLTELNS